jgi:hypothetical protein
MVVATNRTFRGTAGPMVPEVSGQKPFVRAATQPAAII